MKLDIEKHFQYKWTYDKNEPFNNDFGKTFMMQLDIDAENRILRDYTFMDFLTAFKELFDLEKIRTE